MDPKLDEPLDPARSEAGLERGAPEAIAADLGRRDFTELPMLDTLHIDEIEPPSPSEAVPDAPAAPIPAPDASPRSLRSAKALKSPKGARAPLESMRARAEEVNSGSKLVPKIEEEVEDFFGLEIELAAWFVDAGVDLDSWLTSMNPAAPPHKPHTGKMPVDDDEQHHHHQQVKTLLYNFLVHRNAVAVSDACAALTERVVAAKDEWMPLFAPACGGGGGGGRGGVVARDDFEWHTLLFVCLSGWYASRRAPLLDEGVDVVTALLGQIAGLRWFAELDDEEGSSARLLARLFRLARVAVLATLGGRETLRATRAAVWDSYNLEMPENEDEFSTPIHYAEFMEEITKRYPACFIDQNDAEHVLGTRLRNAKRGSMDAGSGAGGAGGGGGGAGSGLASSAFANGSGAGGPDDGAYDPADPRDLVSNQNAVMPFVPQSILEACEVYKSRVRTTPSILQLSEVQALLDDGRAPVAAAGAGTTNGGPPNGGTPNGSTPNGDTLNGSTLNGSTLNGSTLNGSTPNSSTPNGSTLTGGHNKPLPPAVSAIRAIYARTVRTQKSFVRVVIDFLMQAGKAGPGPSVHAAVTTVYFLLQWFDAGHVLMFEHLAALLFNSQFHLVAHLFCSAHPRVATYALTPYAVPEEFWATLTSPSTVYDGPALDWSARESAQLVIRHFNKHNLQTFTHLVGVSRLMVTGKTQRLLVVAELPVEPFKPLFSIYERHLWLQLLLYMKAQVPFTGKRWRYLNMELISAIYLYCPSRIDDNWLSGRDVTQVVRDAPAEEATLRGLVERYNRQFH